MKCSFQCWGLLTGLVILGMTVACLVPIWMIFVQYYDRQWSPANMTNVNGPRPSGKRTTIHCPILILGSGFAGSFAAYTLSPSHGQDVCVVEKLARYGGKIWDVSPGSTDPSAPSYGLAALRIRSNQIAMLELAKDLGIEFQDVEPGLDLYKIRDRHFYIDGDSSKPQDDVAMCHAFHNLTCETTEPGTTASGKLFKRLVDHHSAYPDHVYQYPDITSYVNSIFSNEERAFLHESSTSAATFGGQVSQSSRSLLDGLTTGGQGSMSTRNEKPTIRYPIGGMSLFVKRMVEVATKNNVRIFLGENVELIEQSGHGTEVGQFRVTTTKYEIFADAVLSSAPPMQFADIRGSVADAIKEQRQFQMLRPIPVAVAAVWWHSRWWESSSLNRDLRLSRVLSRSNCFSVMEIPSYEYAKQQNVTRAVYDNGNCVDMWRNLINHPDENLLAQEIRANLQRIFYDVTVPEPKHVHSVIQENAWHFQKPQSEFSNDDILKWSQHPLPGRNISLIGESVYMNLSGWCQGAMYSTMGVLKEWPGVTFPDKFQMRQGMVKNGPDDMELNESWKEMLP